MIRLVDFSESSRVVTLFTRELGKVGALAKGARRLRGPFAGALDLLSVCRIVLIRKQSESLDLLTEAELIRSFARRRNSLPVFYAGYYIAELLSELTHEYDPHPGLFDLAVESLGHLESGEGVRVILRRFELQMLYEIGHMPHLEGCVACAAALAPGDAAAFSVSAGGVLCPACRGAHRVTVELGAGTLRALQLLARPGAEQWRRLQLSEPTDREARAVTRAAIAHLLTRNLRTTRYLGDS